MPKKKQREPTEDELRAIYDAYLDTAAWYKEYLMEVPRPIQANIDRLKDKIKHK